MAMIDECPDCKCDDNMKVVELESIWGPRYMIKCKECGYKGPQEISEDYAVKAWNLISRD